MDDNILKIKYNVKILKWVVTISFLLANLLFILYNDEEKLVFVCWGISTNGLAIFLFVILSVFPRRYYIFDENGCSYQNIKGMEYFYINWENVIAISHCSWFIISDGFIIDMKEHCTQRKYNLVISPKQLRLVYDKFPKVKAIVDSQINRKH